MVDVAMTQGSITRRASRPLVLLGLIIGLAGCAAPARFPGMAVIESQVRFEYIFVSIEIALVSVDGNTSFETSNSGLLGLDPIVKVLPGTHLIRVLRRRWGSLKGPIDRTCEFTLDAKAGHYYQIKRMYPQPPRMTVVVEDSSAEGPSVKLELPLQNCK
jgi:hypothetical protein